MTLRISRRTGRTMMMMKILHEVEVDHEKLKVLIELVVLMCKIIQIQINLKLKLNLEVKHPNRQIRKEV